MSRIRKTHSETLVLNYKWMILGSGLIQIFCLAGFVQLGITQMAYFGIGAIIFHLALLFLVHNPKCANICLLSFFAECLIMVALCNYFLGYGYGFSVYGIVLVPMCYLNAYLEKQVKHPFFSSTAFTLISIILIAVSIFFGQYDKVNSAVSVDSVKLYFLGNFIVAMFIVMAYSTRYFTIMRSADLELGLQHDRLELLEYYDNLTALRNRNKLEDDINAFVEKNKTYCVTIGDLDAMKQINEEYGPLVGDRVLSNAATIVLKHVREQGICIRWGGEEFLCFLAMDETEGAALVDKIREDIAGSFVDVSGVRVSATMTFGLANSKEADDYKKIIALADQRLHESKHIQK